MLQVDSVIWALGCSVDISGFQTWRVGSLQRWPRVTVPLAPPPPANRLQRPVRTHTRLHAVSNADSKIPGKQEGRVWCWAESPVPVEVEEGAARG